MPAAHMERGGADAADILPGRGGVDYIQVGEHRDGLGIYEGDVAIWDN